MDVCTVPPSPPLLLEALSRLSPHHISTPVRGRVRDATRTRPSPIQTINLSRLSSPQPSQLGVDPYGSPTPSPGSRSLTLPEHEKRPTTLAHSHPTSSRGLFANAAADPDAKTLFPHTPGPATAKGRLGGEHAKGVGHTAVEQKGSKRVMNGSGIPRPALSRNSSSLNDVKRPPAFHTPGKASYTQATESLRVRSYSTATGRPSLPVPVLGSLGRHAMQHRRDGSSSNSRPLSVGNLFNTTIPPDSGRRSEDDSPFLQDPSEQTWVDDDHQHDEDGDKSPASPTSSLPMPGSLSNSSILSLTSCASLPPTTPSDIEPDPTNDQQTDGSTSYFRNVLPLQTVFQPSCITKKYQGPRDSGVGGFSPPPIDTARANAQGSPPHSSEQDDSMLVTPGFNTHPSWPGSLSAMANLPERHVLLARPAPPVMPNTPVKRVTPYQFSSVTQAQRSSFFGRIKNAVKGDGPGSAPQAARQRNHDLSRPSLPSNLPSYGPGSVWRTNAEMSPEMSPSVRTAARYSHSKVQREPTGTWPRKGVPLEPRSHPRRDLLKRTTSSASTFSDASSSGDTVGSDDLDIEMLTPTRGKGGRFMEAGKLFTRGDDARSSKISIAVTNPSPPEVSPTYFKSAQSTFPTPPNSNARLFHPRVSFNPEILRTPASPHPTNSLLHKHQPIKGRHSLPLTKAEEQALGRFQRDFIVIQPLGGGEFGCAVKVEARNPAPGEEGKVWAVKQQKTPFEGVKDRQRQLEEPEILQHLASPSVGGPHPHILHMIDFWEQSNRLYIRTELCVADLSWLLSLVGDALEDGFGESRTWKTLSELSKGLAHIHQAGIIHLDLKPANVLITETGTLKIGDFGLATPWPRPNAATERGFEREGDREYMAPEILRGVYGKPADVFSLGVIALECVCNVVVPDMGEPWHNLRTDDFSSTGLYSMARPELSAIIALMMSSDWSLRPTIEEILSNPVLRHLESMRAAGRASSAIQDEDDSFLEELLHYDTFNDSLQEPEDPMEID